MQLIQALCLVCDQGTSAVPVEAEALCGFVEVVREEGGDSEWS